MKRFTFRLQSVLNYKTHLEDMKKNELGILQHELLSVENRIEETGNRACAVNRKFNEWAQSGMPDETAQLYIQYFEYLRGQRRSLMEQKDDVEERMEAKTMDLIEATKERKVLETLRRRHLDRYMYEANRADQAVLDDIAANTHMMAERR